MKKRAISIKLEKGTVNLIDKIAATEFRTRTRQIEFILQQQLQRQSWNEQDQSQEMSTKEYREHFMTKDNEASKADETASDPFDVLNAGKTDKDILS